MKIALAVLFVAGTAILLLGNVWDPMPSALAWAGCLMALIGFVGLWRRTLR